MIPDAHTHPTAPAQAPHLSAFRHGLPSAAGPLSEQDAAAFERLRRDLFRTYQPRTRDEAECVETMAASQWRMARCRRWQAVVDAHVDALLFGGTAPGHVCDPDQHRWFHKSRDCVDQENRLDRMLCRAREKLLLLQKLRRKNLIVGAIETTTPWEAFEAPGHETRVAHTGGAEEPVAAHRDASQPIAPRSAVAPSAPPTPSTHVRIGKSDERTSRSPEPAALRFWPRARAASVIAPGTAGWGPDRFTMPESPAIPTPAVALHPWPAPPPRALTDSGSAAMPRQR